MKFFASLALMAATALAGPIGVRSTHATSEFKLKTHGATIDALNNLYVYAYHSGAGLNDAVLSSNASEATPFWITNGTVYADLEDSYSWGLSINGDTDEASWEPVVIDADGGESGYSITHGKLVGSSEEEFDGWLVCPWYHNAPQLFGLVSGFDAVIPSSCSKVTLEVIYE
ncbi:hypothetical protein N7488_000688 [Penicillium malachiteum]|nr:hypothetical protein N7488_000688 [Penicillium malachiteum]